MQCCLGTPNLSTYRIQNPDIPRAGRGGSGRGGAWPGRKGRRRSGSPRKHLSLVHNRVPKTTVLKVSSAARTMSFVFKTDGRTKPAVDQRFIRGLSAVDQQGEKRPSFLAADQCTDAYVSM